MRRYRHRATGVTVRVADTRAMGREWEPLSAASGPHSEPGRSTGPPPSLLAERPAEAPAEEPQPSTAGPPPRAGRGASRRAWITYAARVTDTDPAEFADWSREDIIDLVDRE